MYFSHIDDTKSQKIKIAKTKIVNIQNQNISQIPPIRGGRNNRRGQQLPWQRIQQQRYGQNLTYAPNVPQYIQNPYQNQIKRFANWNYCSTHGYDVDDFHTSETCQNPSPRHNFNATRDNPMGGSTKNYNKILFPNSNQHTWQIGAAQSVKQYKYIKDNYIKTQACTPQQFIIPDSGATNHYVHNLV